MMPRVPQSEIVPPVYRKEKPVADGKEPFRFARRALLFFAPLLLVLGGIEAWLWRTGETWPITRVIEMQQKHPEALFMRGILDQGFYRYKFLQTEGKAPQIVVLGSSRVMEFRSEMFGARRSEMFNAGGMIQDLSDLEAYVQSLPPNGAPEVVILGLDLWWFEANKPLVRGFSEGIKREASADWQEHVRIWRRFKSSKTRKPALAALRATNQNIGIEARSAEVGFRADGSMQYNFPAPTRESEWKFVDRERPPIAERIKNRAAQFTPWEGDAKDRFDLLERCLDAFKARNMLVLGFLPPFSSEAAAMLQESAAHSGLWQQVRKMIPEIFKRRDLPFVDASMPSELGLNDSFLVDGIHAAETFQLHVLARFLEDKRVQAVFPNLREPISRALNASATNPWHPDYTPLLGREE